MNQQTSNEGELREAGKIRMLSGNLIDLRNLHDNDITIEDIAWGLGRTLRYGGHIREDYTVAHHSIIMSYLVPEEYALEALLHDAAEAYVGDIIWPVKALFPEVEAFENMLANKILQRFGSKTHTQELFTLAGGDGEGDTVWIYKKSVPVADADYAMLQHECYGFGRPGVFNDEAERAWLTAAREHEQWWFAPTYAFLERFDQLTGANALDLQNLEKLWFSQDSYSDEQVAMVEAVLAAMEAEDKEVVNG